MWNDSIIDKQSAREHRAGMLIEMEHGILAQLGEHLPYKQRVTGSSPVGPISI